MGLLAGSAMGCSKDLGECDGAAARTLYYTAQGVPHYGGQALTQETCAGGAQCHSASATDSARVGVPLGLDFDVPVVDGDLPTASQDDLTSQLRTGLQLVREWGHEMHAQVEKGAMPPGEAGQRDRPTWYAADGSGGAVTGDSAALPDIREPAGQEILRNWLACGTPVVSATPGADEALAELGDVQPKANNLSGPQDDWDSIYELVIGPACGSTCHTENVNQVFPTSDLDLSLDADGGNQKAYDNMFEVPAYTGGPCSGMGTLIVPNDCEGSLLIDKLRGNDPGVAVSCGEGMPLGGVTLPASSIDAICSWIDAGAVR